ncbi:DNA repair protein RecO (recombination protein O) [Scopulibacillus daqui]|uniref:DNA repair protein RecO n=2 Tax=Scopulibacillus daqui TaxID=1469162 RepID=A0ABS2Q0H4_9BACL|nr:DNA repair protein RecO (recombination protein O) [Scopulibacillus daqui]
MEKAEGIIIKTINYGETNKVITLFTREHGKIGLMARGAKKAKSKLAAASQLLMYGQFLFKRGKGLGVLYQGEPILSFRSLKTDLNKMAYAAYIVEMLDKLTDSNIKNPYLFELLLQILSYIDEGVDPDVLTRIFEVKMLKTAGIEPELNACVHCGSNDGPFSFSMSSGGLICRRCSRNDQYVMPISQTSVKLLRLFKYFDLKRLGEVNLKKETKDELKHILSAYYDHYSGLNLKSKRFLDQLDAFEKNLASPKR